MPDVHNNTTPDTRYQHPQEQIIHTQPPTSLFFELSYLLVLYYFLPYAFRSRAADATLMPFMATQKTDARTLNQESRTKSRLERVVKAFFEQYANYVNKKRARMQKENVAHP